MENRRIKPREQTSLQILVGLNYINRTVPEIENKIESMAAGNIKGIHKFYLLQIYREMENYLTEKLEIYGASREKDFDELAKKLVFAGKSLICPLTFDYILEQAKLGGVSPRMYVDDAFAIGKPQTIINSLVPYEKEAAYTA